MTSGPDVCSRLEFNWNSSMCCQKWDAAPSKTSFCWLTATIKVTFCALTYSLFLLFHVWSLSGHLQPPPTPPPQKKNNEWINKYPPHLNALLRGCFFFHDISLLYFNATTCHRNCYVKWSFRCNGMKSNLPKVVTDLLFVQAVLIFSTSFNTCQTLSFIGKLAPECLACLWTC